MSVYLVVIVGLAVGLVVALAIVGLVEVYHLRRRMSCLEECHGILGDRMAKVRAENERLRETAQGALNLVDQVSRMNMNPFGVTRVEFSQLLELLGIQAKHAVDEQRQLVRLAFGKDGHETLGALLVAVRGKASAGKVDELRGMVNRIDEELLNLSQTVDSIGDAQQADALSRP